MDPPQRLKPEVSNLPVEDPYPPEEERVLADREVRQLAAQKTATAKQAPEEKKVSLVEIILMLMFAGLFELIELGLGLIGVGVFTNSITNFLFSGLFFVWFFMKGITIPTFVIGFILEFIPFLNLLPIRLATVIITIFIANSPKLSKATQIAGVVKGGAATKVSQGNRYMKAGKEIISDLNA